MADGLSEKQGATWRAAPRLVAFSALLALAACEEGAEGGPFGLFQAGPGADAASQSATTTKLVERDVEAPEVFYVTESGLWDGRPSLGGVWVAHPDVTAPERVIIRNSKNSKFVIGALFKRERVSPGPAIQVSSDAAAALGMLAGAPAELNVTALRRETAPDPEAQVAEAPTDDISAPGDVETSALGPATAEVEGTAAAAIEAAETSAQPAAPARTAATSTLDKPFLQIGIFSVEQNARNTATAMRQNGMVPTVREQSLQGKTYWRVIVGPSVSRSERSTLLRKIKEMGFEDAYPVSN